MPAKKKASKKPKVMGQLPTKGARSKKAVAADKQRQAKPPGRRRSATGQVYTERRANRSDVNRTKRL